MLKPTCSISGCSSPTLARGWCRKHYQRWWNHGDPEHTDLMPRGEVLPWLQERFDADDTDECFTFPRTSSGYPSIRIDGEIKMAHIIVCEWANGPRPLGLVVAHSCGNGHLGCLNRRHLRWTTQSDNMMDRRTHGTNVTGNRSKVTKADVLAIRDDTRPLKEIAEDYGISVPTASEIRNRKTWTWL